MISRDVFIIKLKLIYGDDGLDYDKIMVAYDFGKSAHEGQKRKSGEPYFVHPISVALILSELKMDTDTIISGLLHDVVEDTTYTFDDIAQRFGITVARLVDGVTKLGKVKYADTKELETENLRKMFLAMAEDIRVILIKLADRLHNIRTLMYMPPEKQIRIARETLEVYTPIAHRLGIFKIKWELEDICLSYIEPGLYKKVLNLVNQKKSERDKDIEKICAKLKKALSMYTPDAEIYGRPKNYYSIYRKMFLQKKSYEEIFDITAIRIIVDTKEECWGVLGIVHSLWTPVQGRLKDYISVPKVNMYRSLHTTVLGEIGKPFEVQIRTKEMHQMAEYGIAAHWKYKMGSHGEADEKSLNDKLTWLRQMIEDEEHYETSKDFVDSMKYEIVSSKVYVTTPKGKVIELPSGSTPVDFAYKIHSDVGNRCIGAKVDGKMVSLNFILENGKIVEILTSKNSGGPSRDWLTFVKSAMAKNKIKSWFKKQNREENIEKGIEMLEREIVRNGFKTSLLYDADLQKELLAKLSTKTMDDLYASIGYGGILTHQVIPKIREHQKKQVRNDIIDLSDEVVFKQKSLKKDLNKSEKGVVVKDIGATYVKLAKCCSPVKGDAIIGFITRGRGVTVHQNTCPNLEKTELAKTRYIEVYWSESENKISYTSEIQITAPDKKGLLSEISVMLSECNVGVNGVNAKKLDNGMAVIKLSVEIDNKNQLDKIITKFKQKSEVVDVRRISS